MTFLMHWGLILTLGLLTASVQAQGFSALVSPPRVETAIKPGQTTRQVLEITQVGPLPGRFRVYSNDWSINASGGVDFFDELQPGSCRPWVALERREMTVGGNAKQASRRGDDAIHEPLPCARPFQPCCQTGNATAVVVSTGFSPPRLPREREKRPYFSSSILLLRTPTFSISTSIVSPAFIHTGGVRA